MTDTHPVPDDPARRALTIHARLAEVYGAPFAHFNAHDPMSELVSSFLNHRTRNRDAGEAYRTLRARFPTWEEARNADVAAVQSAIHRVTWPEQKAPRLLEVLRDISDRMGTFDLAFLADLPVPDARAWLETLPGVGPKTSAAVLSFSTLRRPALPVDSHHHRVAQRTGLIATTVAVGPSHAILEGYLPDAWTAQQVYDHHQLFMRHGQQCCHWRAPDCARCALLDLCPTGQGTEAQPDQLGFDFTPSE